MQHRTFEARDFEVPATKSVINQALVLFNGPRAGDFKHNEEIKVICPEAGVEFCTKIIAQLRIQERGALTAIIKKRKVRPGTKLVFVEIKPNEFLLTFRKIPKDVYDSIQAIKRQNIRDKKK